MTPLQLALREHQQVISLIEITCAEVIRELIEAHLNCFQTGGKVLIFGNGGSAADAQHVAAEFVNRLNFDRAPLPAIALTTDSSILTCVGNDACFENVFARQVEAIAKPGDLVVGITTSGGSANVIRALETARRMQAIPIGFTGAKGQSKIGTLCDYCLAVPSDATTRIQEAHILIWHVICAAVESRLFG